MGTGLVGLRRSLPKTMSRNTFDDGGVTFAATVLWKAPSWKCGDLRIRSSRSPLGRPPIWAGTCQPALTSAAPAGTNSADMNLMAQILPAVR